MRRNAGGGFGRGGRRGVGGGLNTTQIDACICPHCGYKETHQRGTPCNSIKCSQCGTPMVRI